MKVLWKFGHVTEYLKSERVYSSYILINIEFIKVYIF